MIGIFITARCGSTRLPKKHLRKINDKPVLLYLIERISNEFRIELNTNKCEICIVTGNEKENKELELFKAHGSLKVFYGNDRNIPQRHYECAEKYDYSSIISLDGDDILSSTKAMRSVYELLDDEADYAGTEGLPFGMNVTGYSTKILSQSLNGHLGKVLETGWHRIFSKVNKRMVFYENAKQPFRVSLDYAEDLEFFTQLLMHTENYITADTKEFVTAINANNLSSINSHLNDEYWEAFSTSQEMEANNVQKK